VAPFFDIGSVLPPRRKSLGKISSLSRRRVPRGGQTERGRGCRSPDRQEGTAVFVDINLPVLIIVGGFGQEGVGG